MLSNAQVQQALAKIQQYFDKVNSLYINKIASQIRKIGELSQSSINRMVILDEITADAAYVTSQLRRATGLSKVDISNILTAAAADVYTDPRFNNAYILRRAGAAKSAMAQRRLNHYLEIMLEQTSMMMDNFSNTTIISPSYRHAADVAITAVSSGLESYTEATRRVIRQIGYNGLQVQYASGYHRRLDTAIRQNVLDAVHQIAQHGADIYGQELGFNAVELSAHLHPAKDHEQVQGHVFLKTEFAKMQAGMDCVDVDGRSYTGFRRKIGEWNCMHMAVPFDTRYSVRRYTDEQLQSWLDQNKRGCVIDGKAYTIYEASQLMRKVETQVRRLKDAANAAKAAGDDQLRRQLQGQINDMMVKYQQIAAISGLAEQRQRTSVEGFRAVSTKGNPGSPGERERGKDERQPFFDAEGTKVPRHMLHHDAYRSVFDQITENEKVNQAIYDSAVEILEHRDQSVYEDLHLINGITGEVIYRLSSNVKFGTKYNSEIQATIKAAKEKHIPIISIHNHPNNTPPSLDDGSSACYRGYQFGIVVGHNLSLYRFTPTTETIPAAILEKFADQLEKEIQNQVEIDETDWYNRLRKFGMEVTRYDK